jgi:hypothetical protein
MMRQLALAALLSLPVAAAAYPQLGPSGMPNVTGIGKTYSTPSYSSTHGSYNSYSPYSNNSSYSNSYRSSYGSSYGNSYSSPRY